MSSKNILIINQQDDIIDMDYKIPAHKKAILHRAFSVLIFNNNNEMLVQRRASHKYHSAGLWTNTCCGHPFNEKPVVEYAQQRLIEEMGMSCDLKFKFKFAYCSALENGLIENEIDHVFVGVSEQQPILNPKEADLFSWVNEKELRQDVHSNPNKYTVWFRLILDYLEQNSLTFEKLVQTFGTNENSKL